MARGTKRMWVGVTLASLGVLAGAMVVASRWQAFEVGWTGARWVRHLSLRAGELNSVLSFVTDASGDAVGTQPGTRILSGFPPQRVDAPEGPAFELSMLTRFTNAILSHQYGNNRDGMDGRFVSAIWTRDASVVRISVVAWPIPAFFLMAGALPLWSGWRVRRRVRSGGCLGCGYDLSATPGPAPCPECGAQRVGSETGRSMRNALRTL